MCGEIYFRMTDVQVEAMEEMSGSDSFEEEDPTLEFQGQGVFRSGM